MSFRRLALAALFSLLAARASALSPELPAPWLPADPDLAATGLISYANEHGQGVEGFSLVNRALRFEFRTASDILRPKAFGSRWAHTYRALNGEMFSLTLRDKRRIGASQFRIEGEVQRSHLEGRPEAARAAERRGGYAFTIKLVHPATGLHATWRATLRDGTNYIRTELRLESDADIDIAQVALLDLDLDKAWTAGTTPGSPVVAEDSFFGFEHPMAQTHIDGKHVLQFVRRVLPLRAHVPVDYSAVFGVAAPGQLRRGFMAYLENERATPFRTFLHYNSWYDIGYFTPYTEQEAVDVIDTFGRKLVKERGVKMDSFLFDDGWDDHQHLWQFNEHFPHGFTPVREAAERIGAEPGVWLSPWGGYGPPRQERLAAAKAGGFEVDDQGLALSGPKYYALFHDATLGLLKNYGINQFKLDGTGSPDKVTPGSAFDSDFAAAIALIGDLRAVKPDLFVNLTTGTWPSPFWLRTADSIWRGGEDHEFAGVGSNRQRWITYRDADTYGGIVRLGPLYPLNSLMLHGIVYARSARGLNVDPQGDFTSEVRSYFASGTGLQEMYVSPDLLTERNWDDLAAAAKWARAHAGTLRDSHWIGGDPARLQVYGWASWSPGQAIVALRNPSDQPQDFALDIGTALELPAQEPRAWNAKPAYEKALAPRALTARNPAIVHLAPFQVQVWELSPAR